MSMPSTQNMCVEMTSLMALSDLEQLKEPWFAMMQSIVTRSVAVGFRLALVHLAQTSKRIQMADVIQQAETKLEPRTRATALEASSVAFNDSVTIERAPVERFIDIFEHSNETIKKLAVKSSYENGHGLRLAEVCK